MNQVVCNRQIGPQDEMFHQPFNALNENDVATNFLVKFVSLIFRLIRHALWGRENMDTALKDSKGCVANRF